VAAEPGGERTSSAKRRAGARPTPCSLS
jgi:hypothetical protein